MLLFSTTLLRWITLTIICNITIQTEVANQNSSLTIPKDAKCPVCGMFVAKYEKWIATIKTEKRVSILME